MHYSMVNYNSPQQMRMLLEERGIRLQKRFGQNFLVEPRIRSAICDVAGCDEQTTVWEIGPGIGALTQELLQRCGWVTVFEIDYGLIELLRELFTPPGIEIVAGDCLETVPERREHAGKPDVLVGNLPYYTAGAIVVKMLEGKHSPPRMAAMVQREAAERMTAYPGSKAYSAFTVACQARCYIKIHFDAPPEAFYPRPEVTSSLVELLPKEEFSEQCELLPPWFSSLVRRSFQSRRKTLRNNMKGPPIYPGIEQEQVLDACRQLGIAPETRAERISVEQFIHLAHAVVPQGPRPE